MLRAHRERRMPRQSVIIDGARVAGIDSLATRLAQVEMSAFVGRLAPQDRNENVCVRIVHVDGTHGAPKSPVGLAERSTNATTNLGLRLLPFLSAL